MAFEGAYVGTTSVVYPVTLKTGGSTVADIGGVIGVGFPASKTATIGGSVAGFKMVDPPS